MYSSFEKLSRFNLQVISKNVEIPELKPERVNWIHFCRLSVLFSHCSEIIKIFIFIVLYFLDLLIQWWASVSAWVVYSKFDVKKVVGSSKFIKILKYFTIWIKPLIKLDLLKFIWNWFWNYEVSVTDRFSSYWRQKWWNSPKL